VTTAATTTARQALIGIVAMVGAIALFSVMDVMIKALSGRYGTVQIYFFRSLLALIPAWFVLHSEGGMAALKTNVFDVTESLSAFKDETAAMIKTAAEGTPAATPSSDGAAAAGDTQMAAATSGEEAAPPPPGPGVQRLGIGGSAWAVEGLVSVGLSAIQGEDSARVYVNRAPLVLELDRAVRLRDLPSEAGDCTATLKGIHGRQADIAVDCQG